MNALPVPVPHAEECLCEKCGEGVYFVPGIAGPQRWRHCRTDSWICTPVCALCGEPGEVKIGRYSMGGGGVGFVLDHWECGACARKTLRVEAL